MHPVIITKCGILDLSMTKQATDIGCKGYGNELIINNILFWSKKKKKNVLITGTTSTECIL